MTFMVGSVETEHVAKASSLSKAAIPDMNFQGLRDTVQIDQDGIVKRLQVNIDISHSNISNLRVEINSPRGKRAVLHNRTGIWPEESRKDL